MKAQQTAKPGGVTATHDAAVSGIAPPQRDFAVRGMPRAIVASRERLREPAAPRSSRLPRFLKSMPSPRDQLQLIASEHGLANAVWPQEDGNRVRKFPGAGGGENKHNSRLRSRYSSGCTCRSDQ